MDGTATAQLRERVEEIREHLVKAKEDGWSLNEADTERVVISPILTALGYGPLDIRQRGHDSVANNFPDYTLLPSTPQKWFLEVKRLDLALQDGEAAQAVNYANNQGAEWAVLTNGRKWFIYNAHLPKPLTEKRVFQIDDLFADDATLKTLQFLSRASMLSGGLSAAWAFERVQGIVKAQLETPNSAVRKQLRKIAAEETKATISDALIEQALRSLSPTHPMITGDETGPIPIPPPKPPVAPSVTGQDLYTYAEQDLYTYAEQDLYTYAEQDLYTYAEIVADYDRFNNKQPHALHLGSESIIPVSSWKQANELTTEYLCKQYGPPPLPFPKPDAHGACFINSSPAYPDGRPFKAYYALHIGDECVYVQRYVNVFFVKKQVSHLLEAIGVPQDSVKVSIK